MYPSNFRKNFQLLVCAPANQQTKWRQMTADLNLQFAMYRRFFSVNTENELKTFDAGGLKVTRAVPEKHINNFFWPYDNFRFGNLDDKNYSIATFIISNQYNSQLLGFYVLLPVCIW